MPYNYCRDHRSGITYVYDVVSFIDESGKRQRTRKLVGRLDENNVLVPTSGRRGRLPKKRDLPPIYETGNQNRDVPPEGKSGELYQGQIATLNQEISSLRSSIASLQKEKMLLINGMKRLLEQMQ